MSGKYLQDKNIIIAILGGEQSVVDQSELADQFYISSTIAGEMFYGAYNSANVDHHRAEH